MPCATIAVMERFIIIGAQALAGEVAIQGSKNTILPLIAASLLTKEPVVLENVPDIQDAATMIAIAEKLGAAVAWERRAHRLEIRARDLAGARLDARMSRKLRGSILFSGALLGRLRHAELPYPGGDAIGARPLGTHLRAIEALGVKINEDGDTISMDGRGLRGGEATLEEPSVTATENTILAAVLAPGKTFIRLAAFEPHLQELVRFLTKMGAKIAWGDQLSLQIHGVERLRGAIHRVNPDELEVSSFAALAAATRSEITLTDIEPSYLDAVFLQLRKMGVSFLTRGRRIKVLKTRQPYRSFRVQSGLYPKLGSDHLPPFAVLATQAEGQSLIHDWLYEKRFSYIPELQKMGANCRMLDPHRVLITGPTELAGTDIAGPDIRSGMTLVIAGLVASGQTTISGVEHLDRGYERLEERLRAIGADIKRVV